MQKFKVNNLTPLNDSSYLLTLTNISKKDFMWSAGQYIAVHFDRRGRKTPVRCFSIVGDPTDKNTIAVAIKKTGKFTQALNNIQPGQIVYVQGPFGDFLLPERVDTPLVFFAGGIGITPFISMLLDLSKLRESNPVELYYSCRSQEYVAFKDILQKIAEAKPNIRVTILLKNGELPSSKNITYSRGEIEKQLVDQIVSQNRSNTDYYLCGPASFMNSISSELLRCGVYEDNIIIEAFGQRNLVSAQERFSINKKIYAASALGLVFSFGIFSSGSALKAIKSEIKEHEAAESQQQKVDSANSISNDSTTQSSNDSNNGYYSSGSTYQSTPTTTYNGSSSNYQQNNSYNAPVSGVS